MYKGNKVTGCGLYIEVRGPNMVHLYSEAYFRSREGLIFVNPYIKVTGFLCSEGSR